MMVVVMAYSLSHGIRQKDELLVQIWQLLLPGTMTFWASGEEEIVLSYTKKKKKKKILR
jgi:hypothetical protein